MAAMPIETQIPRSKCKLAVLVSAVAAVSPVAGVMHRPVALAMSQLLNLKLPLVTIVALRSHRKDSQLLCLHHLNLMNSRRRVGHHS